MNNNQTTFAFAATASLKSSKNKKNPVYAIKFNPHVVNKSIFATVSTNRVLIYEFIDESKKIELLEQFESASTEYFYAIDWSIEPKAKSHLISAGGLNRVIRIINLADKSIKSLLGHGGCINDLKFLPINSILLLSASKDYTIRMWNVESSACLAIFAGEVHFSQVLSIDIAVDGKSFVSAGIDNVLAVWNLEQKELTDKIEQSLVADESTPPTHPIKIMTPSFATREVHKNFIDSVICMAGSYISRCEDGEVVWWKPGPLAEEPGNITTYNMVSRIIQLKTYDDATKRFWFVRLGIDRQKQFLALGEFNGNIRMWDLDAPSLDQIREFNVSHSKLNTAIRMISFSRDGRLFAACTEDEKVFIFQKQ